MVATLIFNTETKYIFNFWAQCPVDNPDILLGVPKRIGLLSNFEFLSLGGVFLGVKNNSKNSGMKKNIGIHSKVNGHFFQKNVEDSAI